MYVQTGPVKLKAPAIRANPVQTTLLKAAYAISHNPSSQTIRELSQQAGLPEKWISNWFGRQRSKSRKAGEIIDMTASSSVSTNATDTIRGVPPPTMTFKTEYLEGQMDSEPPSSSPRSTVQDLSVPVAHVKLAGPTRRRAPRTRKPKAKTVIKPEPQESLMPQESFPAATLQKAPELLPPVPNSRTRGQNQNAFMQSRLPLPPPTRSRVPPEHMSNRIQSKNNNDDSTIVPMGDIYSSTDYFSVPRPNTNSGQSIDAPRRRQGPIMRANFRHSVPNDYYSDPTSVDAVSPYQKDLNMESQRLSSPAPSAARDPLTTHSRSTAASTPAYEPFSPTGMIRLGPTSRPDSISPGLAQDTLRVQQAPWSLSPQALMALLNDNPAVYRAMLLSYATVFPTLLPALTGAMTAPAPEIPEVQPLAHPSTLSPADRYHPTELPELPPLGSPRLPAYTVDDETDVPLSSGNDSTAEKGTLATPWNSGSDYLDFSGLHYDYAPLSHLSERLEPFRLPESTFLFGREDVVNHLLDDRLAVEEPFQAAMGLVLLSKLGLQW